MYIRKIHVSNIRSIAKLEWKFPEGKEAGWHVVIGDNGSGKTTLLRAIALALVGADEAAALRENWNSWLRNGEGEGHVELSLDHDPHSDHPLIFAIGEPASITQKKIGIAIGFSREDDGIVHLSSLKLGNDHDLARKNSELWAGWFSAAYGPFRRFTGGDKESEKIFSTHPRLAAHLSIFSEDVALTECLDWLRALKFKQLEEKPEGALLDRVTAFVNQKDFLPHHARLTEVSSNGVFFTDAEGHLVSVEELSDGYRSVLSMTFELIRQMAHFSDADRIFDQHDPSRIIAPGVVLIDEIDAHLHPTWQRRIGLWFRKHFPNIQFIVTTHSPLICQAAEVGTVWRLPKPGSGEEPEMVTGIALDRLLYGNVLDAYGTELFGKDVGRSETAKEKLERLAELNIKELNEGLTEAERREQEELRAALPTRMHSLPREVEDG